MRSRWKIIFTPKAKCADENLLRRLRRIFRALVRTDRRHASALVRLADFGPFRQAGFEIVE